VESAWPARARPVPPRPGMAAAAAQRLPLILGVRAGSGALRRPRPAGKSEATCSPSTAPSSI
jgi:hypothetical protein